MGGGVQGLCIMYCVCSVSARLEVEILLLSCFCLCFPPKSPGRFLYLDSCGTSIEAILSPLGQRLDILILLVYCARKLLSNLELSVLRGRIS